MRYPRSFQRSVLLLATCGVLAGLLPAALKAQGPPPSYRPEEVEDMVNRIALYPDPLIAQILPAATYPDQIPDAAHWSDEHHYLRGDDLAHAIVADHLPWDPAVQSLLPFPSVLEMMASDMNWTSAIGNAFLSQQGDVMEAIQRLRRRARDYGYLRSSSAVMVGGGPYITILPVRPDYVCVPVYDPHVVFFAPRAGFYAGSTVAFGFGISLGYAFRPWGWGESHFAWDRHEVYVGESRWDRNWDNRRVYVHPYRGVERWSGPPHPIEEHARIQRDEAERNAARRGYSRPDEHHEDPRHDDHHDSHDNHDHGHH